MNDNLSRRSWVSAQVSFTSTGDKATFTPAKPLDIVRWGIIADALIDVGAGMVVSMEHRVNAGTDTGRVVIDTMTFGVDADIAQGAGRYKDVVLPVAQATGVDNSLVNVGPSGPFPVNPGDQVVFEVTNAADTAGTGFLFIEYNELSFAGDRIASMTEAS